MKNIIKNLIVSTLVLGAFVFAQPGILQADANTTFTVFNSDNKPTAQAALGAQGVSYNWSTDSVVAQASDTVTLNVRYKNTGNWDATNSKIQLVKSESSDGSQKTATYNVKIWADNTSYPATDIATIKFPATEAISYIAGSAKWFPNQSTVEAGLPLGQDGSEVLANGLNIGVIKSKYSCPSSNLDCREGHVLVQFKVSGTLYACNDGIDNDSDALIDMADPGCTSSSDNDESNTSSVFSVSTMAPANVNKNSATLKASFANANGSSVQVWFQYGTSSAFGSNSQIVTVGSSNGTASVDLTGLSENTTYFFRAVAKDSVSVKNASNILDFTTSSVSTVACNDGIDNDNDGYVDMSDPGCSSSTDTSEDNSVTNLPPVAKTDSPSNITSTGAVFNGRVNPNGHTTTVWFEYGTNESDLNKTVGNQNAGNDSDLIDVSFPVSGLNADSTYFYRTVASNNYGTVPGSIRSFKTNAATANAPKAITSLATSVGKNSAKLNALIVIDLAASTKAHFEYGKTTNLGKSTADEVVGSSGQITFDQVVSGLDANTIYFFKAVAENSYGKTSGDIVVFKTAASGGNTGGGGTSNSSGLISLKIASKFSEVAPGDIIDLTVSYKALAKLENAVLRVSFPEGVKFRKTTIGVFSNHDKALIVDLGTLEKDKSGEAVIQIEITNKVKNEDLLAINALATFDTASGGTEDALAYGLLKVKREGNNLGAAAIFGDSSFLPDTLVEWIILVAALAALALLGREIYFRGAKRGGDVVGELMVPADLPVAPNSLPQVPTSRYANR